MVLALPLASTLAATSCRVDGTRWRCHIDQINKGTFHMTYKCVSPHGVEIVGFASEIEAKNYAKIYLNGARHGMPARHWSRRWVVVAVPPVE